VRDKLPGEGIDAREFLPGFVRQGRQLAVVPARHVQEDIPGGTLNDILIVQQPLGNRGDTLFQTVRHGKIETCFVKPATIAFNAPEEYGVVERSAGHLVRRGETSGKVLKLDPRHRPSGTPILSGGILTVRIENEYRRWAFPEL
jgi:hypothetical protein